VFLRDFDLNLFGAGLPWVDGVEEGVLEKVNTVPEPNKADEGLVSGSVGLLKLNPCVGSIPSPKLPVIPIGGLTPILDPVFLSTPKLNDGGTMLVVDEGGLFIPKVNPVGTAVSCFFISKAVGIFFASFC